MREKSSFINGIRCILTLISRNFQIMKVGRLAVSLGDTMHKQTLAPGSGIFSTENSFIDQS